MARENFFQTKWINKVEKGISQIEYCRYFYSAFKSSDSSLVNTKLTFCLWGLEFYDKPFHESNCTVFLWLSKTIGM